MVLEEIASPHFRFCRDLSERLNLTKDEGEKWIVNLIRETRMGADAKIDLEKVSICVNVRAYFSCERLPRT